jgi:hypothetical protein
MKLIWEEEETSDGKIGDENENEDEGEDEDEQKESRDFAYLADTSSRTTTLLFLKIARARQNSCRWP